MPLWILLIPAAAAVGGWLYGAHKVATKSPPLPHDPPPPTAKLPGTGTVDGHGTGLIDVPPVVAQAAAQAAAIARGQGPSPAGLGLPSAPSAGSQVKEASAAVTAANLEAAAKAAAASIHQSNPNATAQEAALAAEALKIQAMEALNTPATDRTPEQLALLLALGELPILAAKA